MLPFHYSSTYTGLPLDLLSTYSTRRAMSQPTSPSLPTNISYETLDYRVRSLTFLLRIIQATQPSFVPTSSLDPDNNPAGTALVSRKFLPTDTAQDATEHCSRREKKWLRLLSLMSLLLVRSNREVIATVAARAVSPTKGRQIFFTDNPARNGPVMFRMIECVVPKVYDGWAERLVENKY